MSFSLNWHGDAVQAQVKAATQRGLQRAAEYVRGESQQQAPVDEGTLRGSATIKAVDDDAVSVGYYTPYAAKQHEELGYRHPKGGKAKYLEEPLIDGKDTVKAIIAAEVRRATK